MFSFLLDIYIVWYCLYETVVNNIAIVLEQISFDKDTKEDLNKFAKNYRMEVKYYYGYISKFAKLNVHAISPHKIVFSK